MIEMTVTVIRIKVVLKAKGSTSEVYLIKRLVNVCFTVTWSKQDCLPPVYKETVGNSSSKKQTLHI